MFLPGSMSIETTSGLSNFLELKVIPAEISTLISSALFGERVISYN